VQATIAIREGHLGDPGGAASSALRELDQLTDALRKSSELSIPTLAICREVRDVRLATRVMAQRDARDPWWVPAPFDGEPLPAPIRVAVTRNPHGYPIHADIARALEQAAAWLAEGRQRRAARSSIATAASMSLSVTTSGGASRSTLSPAVMASSPSAVQAACTSPAGGRPFSPSNRTMPRAPPKPAPPGSRPALCRDPPAPPPG